MLYEETALRKTLSNKKIIIFVWRLFQREFPAHVAKIAKTALEQGGEVTLVVAENRTEPYKMQFNSRQFLTSIEQTYKVNTIVVPPYAQPLASDLESVDQIQGLSDVLELDAELYLSVLSAFLTSNLITLNSRKLRSQDLVYLKDFVLDYFSAKSVARNLIIPNAYDLAIVLNGRHPSSVATKQVAIGKDLQVMYLERGFKHGDGRLFLQAFQTHDVRKMSEHFKSIAATLSMEELNHAKQWSSSWLVNQASDKQTNRFLVDNSKSRSLHLDEISKVVPIFTSSIDERFSNLGVDLNGWDSQAKAISLVSSRLMKLGYQPIIRIHPNALWKSWRELIELVKEFRSCDLSYILPWEKVSSYHLLDNASHVVTWGSTLALEASARGIPVTNLSKSRYDDLADVKLLSGADLRVWTPENFIKPDSDKSLLAVYLTRQYGVRNDLVSWCEQFRMQRAKKNYLNRFNLLTIHTYKILYFIKSPMQSSPSNIYFAIIKLLGEKAGGALMKFVLLCLIVKHDNE